MFVDYSAVVGLIANNESMISRELKFADWFKANKLSVIVTYTKEDMLDSDQTSPPLIAGGEAGENKHLGLSVLDDLT